MIYYVSHKYGGNPENYEKAKEITHELQIEHPENCYVCPLLTFSHLEYGELGYNEELDICLDLLTVCDAVIVASSISEGVQREIDLADRLGIEVIDLELE